MKDLKFKVWHKTEKRMYYRGYQKLLHVLLCEDDKGENDGRGRPVKRAGYEDCEFLEGSGVFDKTGKEIFEGDIVRVRYKDKAFRDVVDAIQDMFGSRNLHPLNPLLKRHGIEGNPQNLDIEILSNKFEAPELLHGR